MFSHVKELQFNAKVSKPDPRFARLLLEQFGGGNGELKAAMQYFVQAFSCKDPYPEIYDMMMDIATEEFSHLEIVGATIKMLLGNLTGQMKDALESAPISKMMNGKAAKEELINEAFYYPQFGVLSGGGITVTDSNGVPWTGAYVNANSDPTVDLRSDMAAESRAKIVYEYLMKFTDDPSVKETLGFLMTREITHFQQFEAALDTIQPNFPPGVLQQDVRYGNLYFDLSKGMEARGPWNEGTAIRTGDQWQYIEKPKRFVRDTDGLMNVKPEGIAQGQKELDEQTKTLSRTRSDEIAASVEAADMQWSKYDKKDKDDKCNG